jgi:hypothetical protein
MMLARDDMRSRVFRARRSVAHFVALRGEVAGPILHRLDQEAQRFSEMETYDAAARAAELLAEGEN